MPNCVRAMDDAVTSLSAKIAQHSRLKRTNLKPVIIWDPHERNGQLVAQLVTADRVQGRRRHLRSEVPEWRLHPERP